MKEVKFYSYSASKELTLNIDDGFVFVYGGNGCGKTTLSRKLNENQNNKVFNTDFISENVYVTDSIDGIKINSDNKNNFSRLFIGKELTKKAKEIEALNEIKKESSKKCENLLQNFNAWLSKYDLTNIDTSYKIDHKYYSYSDGEANSIESAKKHYSVKEYFDTNLKNDSDLQNSYKKVKEKTVIDSIIKIIKNDRFLDDVFNKKEPIFDVDRINKFNENISLIQKSEDDFKIFNDIDKGKKWVEDGLKFQSTKVECIFCGSLKGQEAVNKWKELIKTKLLVAKRKLLEDIDLKIASIDKIALSKPIYEQIVPEILESSLLVKQKLMKLHEDVLNNKKIILSNPEIKIDNVVEDSNAVKESIFHYLLNKHFIDNYFIILFDCSVKDKITSLNQELDKYMNNYIASISKLINDCLKTLGIDKNVRLKSSKKGTVHTIYWEPLLNMKPSEYSDGEKRKLAIAIFFANIISENIHYDSIVLDDPVDSLDVLTYFNLKGFLIKNSIADKCDSLIILTHNIHYLYIQTSNLFENPKYCNKLHIYQLRKNDLIPISLTFFRMDDVSIFSDEINKLNLQSNFLYVIWFANHLARFFVNFKMSMFGKIPGDDVAPNLKELFQKKDEYDKASEYCDIITKNSRKKTLILLDAKNTLSSLNCLLELLGFPKIVKDDVFKIFTKENENDPINMNPIPSDFNEEIISYGKKIETDSSTIKSYIEHPHYQITESLMAIYVNDNN